MANPKFLTWPWWHQRWWPMPCHPWALYIWLLGWLRHWPWSRCPGDPARVSKRDSSWREKWPWCAFQPYRNDVPYGGLYFPAFWGMVPWVKLLPVRGQLGLRIGDGDLCHTAVTWWGAPIELRPSGVDVRTLIGTQSITCA